LEKVQLLEEETTGAGVSGTFEDTLPFELVDIHVDYGDFKDMLNVFEVGSKQNHKISSLLQQTFRMLEHCSEASMGTSTEQLSKSHLFKICLKRLLKKLCKLI
jgi:hypothetical protein